jgi:Mce-associated membrane protein
VTDTAGTGLDADDEQQDAAAPPPVAGRRSGSGARDRAPWFAAVALFVLAVVLAVLAATFRSDLAAERDDRDEVQRVSGELATALLTYDYRDLEGWKERVLVNATGSFRRTFEDTFSASLEPIVTEVQGSSTATVKEIFLGDISDSSSTAIVVADTVANGTAGRRSSFDTYIQLDLVKVGDRWKVNDVTNLNLGQPEGAGGGNGTPPATVQGTNN